MAEYLQSRDHDIHVCLRRELAENASGSIKDIDLTDVQSNRLDGFCGCHYKELYSYNKKKHHRPRGSQGDGRNRTRGHLKCERNPANHQYKQFESDPSIDLSREQTPTSDTTPLSKCHPELIHYKKYRKHKQTGKVLKRQAAERKITRSAKSSSVTPGMTATNPSNPLTNYTSTESLKSYSEHNFVSVKDKSVHHALKKSHDLNKISESLLPIKHFPKNNLHHRNFCIYTKLLFLHNKRRIKPKSVRKDKAIEGEKKIIAIPAIRKKYKRKPCTNSSYPSNNYTSTESRKSYSEHNFVHVKDKSVHHGLKKSHDVNEISKGLLPFFSKSNSHRRNFWVYTKLLFLHNKRRIKPKLARKDKAIKGENKIIAIPAIRKKYKRKPYNFERDRPTSFRETPILSPNCMPQNFCEQGQHWLTRCLSLSKPSTPYDKTVTVYSVYEQRPERMPAADLKSKSSFNVKFYKSMGDGRQMFGDGSPYMQIPRNYSPTNMARAGRDEDGCICVCIPQENDYGRMVPRYDTGESTVMRYIRILLKDNKRSLRRPPPRPSLYGYGRPNPCLGRMPADYNVGCQFKQNNAKQNFRCNDAAIQCKCKDRRERGSDDIYRRDRGTICSVPTFPEHENKRIPGYNAINSDQQPGNNYDKNAVNIGSNFSFQMGVYKRFIDTNPNQYTFSTNQTTFNEPSRDDYHFVNLPANDPSLRYMDGDARYNTGRGGDDCGCSASNASAYFAPKPSVLSQMLTPRNLNCCSTHSSSNQTISPSSSPRSCGMSKCPSTSLFLKQFERTDLCCNNEPKSHCKPKHKAVSCRCDKKPKVIGCTDSKKNVRIGSTLSASTASTLASCKCYKMKNIGCCCSNEPILAECPKKCYCKKSKKSGECKISSKCEKSSICTKCKKKEKKNNCGSSGKCKKKRSLFNKMIKICKKKERCCCCNERKFCLGFILNTLFEKKPRCNKCNLRKICKCPPKSAPLDYKKVLNNLTLSSRRQKKAEEQPCPCGVLNVKKVLSGLLAPVEPKHQTRAQQCKCDGKFEMKKKFGRLLLSNTVQKPKCCSSVSYDENARSVGIGEEDYRKIPPCCRLPDRSQGDGFQMNKFVSKFIRPETSTKMHYSAFNPLCQCEAGMQHNTKMGPDDRATVCRNQGSCVPRSKPMTVRDCENATCPALHNVDPNRKAVRLGSNCSFSLEFYKGMPPVKAGPPPCPQTCKPPCLAPCADTTSSPYNQAQVFIQKAAKYIVTNPNPKMKFKPTCKQCNNCVKVPIIKRAVAQMILKDKKPLHRARTCQKTNTLQPTRKLVTRKATAGKGLGAINTCDPYVCLKRINQRKCCK